MIENARDARSLAPSRARGSKPLSLWVERGGDWSRLHGRVDRNATFPVNAGVFQRRAFTGAWIETSTLA